MLEDKVKQPKPELAHCTWKECKDRGNYVKCYFDLYQLCPIYKKHKNYLKTVREMKSNKKYKGGKHG